MTANRTSVTTAAERIESLKAGTTSAVSAFLAFSLMTTTHIGWLPFPAQETLVSSQKALLVAAGIALLSGFLFGVTYRYIIRTDQNPHLKSGAVLAFGLVRGLSQVEGSQHLWAMPWLAGLQVVESLVLFVAARLVLDWAMGRGWVKTFSSD
jgi:hypothetical protein